MFLNEKNAGLVIGLKYTVVAYNAEKQTSELAGYQLCATNNCDLIRKGVNIVTLSTNCVIFPGNKALTFVPWKLKYFFFHSLK